MDQTPITRSAADQRSQLVPAGTADSSAPSIKKDAAITTLSQGPQLSMDKKKIYRLALNRLRCVMITLVVFFHCSELFLSASALSVLLPNISKPYMNFVATFAGSSGWPMYIFFTLAGYAAFHSLRVRSVKLFVQDRSLRLVPAIFFDMAIIHPVALALGYFVAASLGCYEMQFDSIWDWYIYGYWSCLATTGELCTAETHSFGSWYLFYLFTLCMLSIPLFLLWKKFSGPRLEGNILTAAFIAGLIVFIFVLWGLDVAWISFSKLPVVDLFADHNFFSYAACLSFGFFIAWCKDAHEILLLSCWFFLGISIGVAAVLVVLNVYEDNTTVFLSAVQYLWLELYAASLYFAVWGFAHKILPFLPHKLGVCFDYVADRAIAIYVLHILTLQCVQAALIYLFLGTIMDELTLLRFLIQFLLTFVLTLGLYEALFRYKYTRILVGMMRISDLQSAPKSVPKNVTKEEGQE